MTSKDPRIESLFETALELEKKGKLFYDQAASRSDPELGGRIFKLLAEEELTHIERIKKIHEAIEAEGVFPADWQGLTPKLGNLGKVFRELAIQHGRGINAQTSDLEALDTGIDLEARSIAFYQDLGQKAASAPEKEFLDKMVDEERSHHTALTDMKFYLSDPAGWFLENEKGGLDGA